MQSIYWIAFVAGGIFVVLAAIGGIDGAEIDVAADVGPAEPDFGVSSGIDQDIELVAQDSSSSQRTRWRFNPLVILASFKFWTFGSCFFGLTGLLLSLLQPQRGSISIFMISLLMGLLIGGMVSLVFHRLRSRNPTGMATPDELVGLLATVEIPINQHARGKIRVQFRDGSRELPARTNDDQTLKVGDSVMIIGLEGNLAWVVSENSLKDKPA